MFNINSINNYNKVSNFLSFCGKNSINNHFSSNNLERSPESDEFKKESSDMSEEFVLTTNVEEAVKSEDKEKLKNYLDNFIETETMVLMSYPAQDVTKAVQTFINACVDEEDDSILDKYVSIIHTAICPNTGVGQYVDTEKLGEKEFKSPLSAKKIKEIQEASSK